MKRIVFAITMMCGCALAAEDSIGVANNDDGTVTVFVKVVPTAELESYLAAVKANPKQEQDARNRYHLSVLSHALTLLSKSMTAAQNTDSDIEKELQRELSRIRDNAESLKKARLNARIEPQVNPVKTEK